MSHQSTVQLSRHAKLRWTMRSGELEGTLTSAWEEAAPLDTSGDLDADEVRYHRDTETLLVRRNGWVVTVLHASYADEAVQAAIDRVGESSQRRRST